MRILLWIALSFNLVTYKRIQSPPRVPTLQCDEDAEICWESDVEYLRLDKSIETCTDGSIVLFGDSYCPRNKIAIIPEFDDVAEGELTAGE